MNDPNLGNHEHFACPDPPFDFDDYEDAFAAGRRAADRDAGIGDYLFVVVGIGNRSKIPEAIAVYSDHNSAIRRCALEEAEPDFHTVRVNPVAFHRGVR